MNKVLITGACGYLGANLSKYLADARYDVTAFDNFDPISYSYWNSLMEKVIIGDIRDDALIADLAKQQFDVVIHLISLDHNKSEDNPNYVNSINVMPTWNILDKFSESGLEKFIYFSTFHVYGKVQSVVVNEDYKPSPQNNYGLTHLLSEQICNYYNKTTDINCINVRLSNSYGSPIFKENNCWWLVINDLCLNAYKKNKIKLSSDGTPLRDFIHFSDVCSAVEILLDSDKKNISNNTYHISYGKTLTILELAHKVKSVFEMRYKKEIKVLLPDNSISDNPNRYKNTKKYIMGNTKIQDLGFKPKINLTTGIQEIFDYLEQPND